MGKAREKLRRQKRKAQRREARREFSRQSAIRQATGEDVIDLSGAPLTVETFEGAFANLEAERAVGVYPGERAEQALGEHILGRLERLGVSSEEVNAQVGRAAMGKGG
jgi:hypothetical protein